MRFRAILTPATLLMACFTATVFAEPFPANDAEARKRPPENQSSPDKLHRWKTPPLR